MSNAKTYRSALAEARKAGAAHAEGAAYLAQTCAVLGVVYGCKGAALYAGAVKLGLAPLALFAKLHESPFGLADVLLA